MLASHPPSGPANVSAQCSITSRGLILDLPLSIDHVEVHQRDGTTRRLHLARLSCGHSRDSCILLFLTLSTEVDDPSTVDLSTEPVPFEHIGAIIAEPSQATFCRGAVIELKDIRLADFVTRQVCIGQSWRFIPTFWKPRSLRGGVRTQEEVFAQTCEYHIPAWVLRRLKTRYGFLLDHHTPRDGLTIPVPPQPDSLSGSTNSLQEDDVVFTLKFSNPDRNETLTIRHGIGCACRSSFRTQPRPRAITLWRWWTEVYLQKPEFGTLLTPLVPSDDSDTTSSSDSEGAQAVSKSPKCHRRHSSVYDRDIVQFHGEEYDVQLQCTPFAEGGIPLAPNFPFRITLTIDLVGIDPLPAIPDAVRSCPIVETTSVRSPHSTRLSSSTYSETSRVDSLPPYASLRWPTQGPRERLEVRSRSWTKQVTGIVILLLSQPAAAFHIMFDWIFSLAASYLVLPQA